jgi:hypothetical protein
MLAVASKESDTMRRIITLKLRIDGRKDEMPDTDAVADQVAEELENSYSGFDVKATVVNTTEKGYKVESEETVEEIG